MAKIHRTTTLLHSHLKKVNKSLELRCMRGVSTLNGQDPEVQLRELREYCQRRGFHILEEYGRTHWRFTFAVPM